MEFLKDVASMFKALFKCIGQSLPGVITNCKKAIKAKKFQYPLLVALMTLSFAALLLVFIGVIFPGGFLGILGALSLPLSIIGLSFSFSKMTVAQVSLRDYCDTCASQMDESFIYLKKEISKNTPTRKKVTGYHYEVTDMSDTKMTVEKVLETTTERAGATYYSVKADIKVIQRCPSCNREEEFVVRDVHFNVFSSTDADRKEIMKKAVFEALQKPQLKAKSTSDKNT